MGLIHFIERCLNGRWRIHILQLDLVNTDPKFIFLNCCFESLTSLFLNFLTADGYDFIHGAVSHDCAHHCFRNMTQGTLRIHHLKKKEPGIIDTILDDPLDLSRIKISSHHAFFTATGTALRKLTIIVTTWCAEAILLLELSADRKHIHIVYSER